MKRLYISLLAVVALLPSLGQSVSFKAKLDSALLLMGKTTTLHLEIVQDKSGKGFFPWEKSDTLSCAAVEIAQKMKADTTDLGNNRIQINRDIILQSFDSGLYSLGPIPYVIGKDTFKTDQLSLKVVPVKVDTTQNIHDYKPVEEVPFKLFDWVPDFISDYWWAWLIALLLVAGGLYYYYFWYKKGRKLLDPERKRLPPYEEAMCNLKKLKADNLWQNGFEKEYFTGLTDILRVYIDRRFQINAVEMTSSQIIDTLRKNDETKAVNEQLAMILEIADFVKFANARPLADDNELAYQRAVNFVESTKPVEKTDPQDDGKGKEDGK
ncbi:MAG: cell wall anchor protein [Bacteroidales bacterium]|nr:cell wall anchor protein [Candidatus Sodaliphilus aphodohippi]